MSRWSKDLPVPVPLVLYIVTTVSYSPLSGRSITFSRSMVPFVRSEMDCGTGYATDTVALARACVTSVLVLNVNFFQQKVIKPKMAPLPFRQFSWYGGIQRYMWSPSGALQEGNPSVSVRVNTSTGTLSPARITLVCKREDRGKRCNANDIQ